MAEMRPVASPVGPVLPILNHLDLCPLAANGGDESLPWLLLRYGRKMCMLQTDLRTRKYDWSAQINPGRFFPFRPQKRL